MQELEVDQPEGKEVRAVPASPKASGSTFRGQHIMLPQMRHLLKQYFFHACGVPDELDAGVLPVGTIICYVDLTRVLSM
eukprot:4787614-Pyramimonas_sp.AAC.1